MKKIILFPKTDTVTLCLPEQWVGVSLICTLTPVFDKQINFDEVNIETARMRNLSIKKKIK